MTKSAAPPPGSQVSRAEVRDALLRSGYLLESRCESILREEWGYVEANATYPDPATGVSREYDLFGMDMQRLAAGRKFVGGYVWSVVAVECVNNPQPVVVLTKEPLYEGVYRGCIRTAGIPNKCLTKPGGTHWDRVANVLGVADHHHYSTGRVGTQYCSFMYKKSGNNQGEWMALHEGAHFESVRKLCDVVENRIDEMYRGWKVVKDGGEEVNLEFYYPVIVVQGDLLEAVPGRRGVTLRSADHLQLVQTVARSDGAREYQIDFVRERYFRAYLQLVRSELMGIAKLVKKRRDLVMQSIASIEARLAKCSGSAEVRAAMDGIP